MRQPVLSLLNARETALFFPDADDPVKRNWHWHDTIGWVDCLLALRPRVLVTGWSSACLPDHLVAAHGGPVEYVCNVTGSVRHLVSRAQIEAGLHVTNWGAMVAPYVAEHALLLVLAALRNLPAWHPPRKAAEIQGGIGCFETKTLRGKRVGILGFGNIARTLVRLLSPFDADIVVFSEGVPPDLIKKHAARPARSLRDLFTHAEVFVCCESLTEATRGCIGRELLSLLPRHATFVNVGRGAIVREDELAAVANERGLRVASDVFAQEPLPDDAPPRSIAGLVASPHIGGPTDDACRNCGRWAVENVDRFLLGQLPVGLITPDMYDRAT
ncbi:phosphoglycerate dehydrogenase [Termitidicoccus mucosus]|uniref:NAD(P)-dependent oxidoreductase n=1 Tax=Termitidicoccus mucosus TaxID=1184151 RepID=UPI0026CBADF3